MKTSGSKAFTHRIWLGDHGLRFGTASGLPNLQRLRRFGGAGTS